MESPTGITIKRPPGITAGLTAAWAIFGLLCLCVTLIVCVMSPTYSTFASPENKTLMQPQGVQGMATNATNIVLIHGFWADASSWNKVNSYSKERRTPSCSCSTSSAFCRRRCR